MLALCIAFLLVATPAYADSPETLLTGAHLAPTLQNWETLFPARKIAAPPEARVLGEGAPIVLSPGASAFLARSAASGLLVIKDGKLRYENYWQGATRVTHFTSMSLAKSITSVLVGEAVAEKRIDGENDPLTDDLAELRGTGFDGVKISDVLEMSSGTQAAGSLGPFADADAFWSQTALHHDTAQATWLKRMVRAWPPGTHFNYSGIDSAAMGALVAGTTGKTLSALLEEKVWRPAGMEDGASWGLDGAGVELAYCCFNARLRDYGRLGLFLMENERLASWMRESSTPQRPELRPGALFPGYALGYGYQWWLTPTGYMGHGAYGQFLLVEPKEHLVIVLLSAWPNEWDYGFEASAYQLFDEITAAAK